MLCRYSVEVMWKVNSSYVTLSIVEQVKAFFRWHSYLPKQSGRVPLNWSMELSGKAPAWHGHEKTLGLNVSKESTQYNTMIEYLPGMNKGLGLIARHTDHWEDNNLKVSMAAYPKLHSDWGIPWEPMRIRMPLGEKMIKIR